MSRAAKPATSLALALVTAALVALASCTPALAGGAGERIILRCTHGESLAGFSQRAYREALSQLSADAEEYTSCSMLIRQAQAAAASSHGGSGAGGGSALSATAPVALAATPSELSSIDHAKHVGSGPVSVGGQLVHPGAVHADIASALSTLPGPLIAVLALMLACVLVLAGVDVRRRARGGRPH